MPDDPKALTRAAQRANELAEALAKINAILEEADATFAVQQTMTLAADFSPRYTYAVAVVSR